jgi:Ca2+-binding EF-hand superfamily protein
VNFHVSPEQVSEFREAFNMFDKDGEGTIGPQEFKGPFFLKNFLH